ncbi:amino acid adenylation domain-containing protein [Brevibacillus borstelensis]|uniref:non-ribosomal peptide synthetase n=1 Tax=Brevibacillus borstelensis TaxID=45462 RepID=UPI00203C4DA4|nr:non-ribosomal peptide synthetase [Brevibacillus borstelensis]MCM3623871.1 amino acid adenylation domain-containing protein [Brevibacillus borstelensis]
MRLESKGNDRLAELSPAKRALLEKMLESKRRENSAGERIPVRPQENAIPLSFAQQRLWFLDQYEPESPVYNLCYAIRLTGNLWIPILERCFQEILDRHEVLRTTYSVVDGEPIQVINPPVPVKIPVKSLGALSEQEKEAEVQRLAREEAQKCFHLTEDSMLRTTLLRLHETEHILLVTIHHIAADGWSLGVLVHEMMQLYTAFYHEQASPLTPLPIQYADFAHWQREWANRQEFQRQLDFWKQKLSGSLPVLQLPTDRPRPTIQTFRGAVERFSLSHELAHSLRDISAQSGTTLFMTLLAAFKTLLFRYTQQDDILVGTPIANRNRSDIEGLIGFFVNTLVMRSQPSGTATFREYLAQIRDVALEAYAHQDVPFEKLVADILPSRLLSHSPLFQVMFILQNGPMSEMKLPELDVEHFILDSGTTKFDLTFSFTETANGLNGSVEYNVDLFEKKTIERMIRHFETLLMSIASNPEQTLSQLGILPDSERRTVLEEWNRTENRELQDPGCTHEMVERQAVKTPDAIAVEDETRQLTYDEVNRRANQLAHYLQKSGVRPDSLVGICLNRSVDTVVAVLAVLKAGGAYVPIDPAYPADRIAYMLEDSRVSILISQHRIAHELPAYDGQCVLIDTDWAAIAQQSDSNPHCLVKPENLAYVIYTSGSTGKPKGVMMAHKPLVNLLLWQMKSFQDPKPARTLQFAPLSFDVSFQEIFSTLCSGGTLLMSEEVRQDPVKLLKFLSGQKVERLFLPFVALQQLAESANVRETVPERLREIITAGEQLQITRHISGWLGKMKGCRLYNHYGPSESHVVTSYTLQGEPEEWPVLPPIGRPIDNVQIYLLDQHLQPVPIGVQGELYIGGTALARGYLNRPDLTLEKFVPHPFSTDQTERLYRTGDVARFLPDGTIEYIGRIDHQVKVRGFRIELGEIEATLGQHPQIRETAVVVREDVPGDRRLVAYVVTEAGASYSTKELRGFLQKRLPEYMIPGTYVQLEALPLSPNGKIDRRALPVPDYANRSMEREYVLPSTPEEACVAKIWSEVLRTEPIGLGDNFFELGGHSLLATQVISRLNHAFRMEIPLKTLFEAPTVRALAESIAHARQKRQENDAPPIQPAPREQEMPLSFAQERLWFFEQFEPGTATYNIPGAIRLVGVLDVHALERSFAEIVRRHESLRTVFSASNGRPIQTVLREMKIPLVTVDLQQLPADRRESALRELIKTEAALPFDITQGPLLRTTLAKLGETEHVLLITMHHIISDGWSLGVFIREMAVLYDAFCNQASSPLPDLDLHYADFAYWQRQYLQGEELEKQLAYWKGVFQQEPPVLQLPTDRPRPASQTFNGDAQRFVLGKQLTDALKTLSVQSGATLYMTLLAGFKTLLHRYSGQEDIAVGSPIANRNRSELEGMIGFFVNTLVIRSQPNSVMSFREYLDQVREAAVGAFAHQDLPFERLVAELVPQRNRSASPLFQVLFVLQNTLASDLALPGLTMEQLDAESGTAKFDLTLSMRESGDELIGYLEYNTDLFNPDTIARLIGHFETLLGSIVQNPDYKLHELPLLTDKERHQLLMEWNQTQTDYPSLSSIQQVFAEQVAKAPDAIALVCQTEQVTYDETNRRANQLARHLVKLGVTRGELVAVCMDRSIDLIVAFLAILKAGAAFLPLDPTYPKERLAYMLEDARASVLITGGKREDVLPWQHLRVIDLDRDRQQIASEREEDIDTGTTADDLAYVMYTSGSTGKPKGVCIPHRGVIRLVKGNGYASFSPEEVFLQFSPVSFDASTFEIWGSLLNGARLVLYPGSKASLEELGKTLREHRVTTLWLTAGLFHQMVDQRLDDLIHVKQLLAGGDVLSVSHVKKVLEHLPGIKLINGYGPTENTTFTCCYPVTDGSLVQGSVSIGRPIANTRVYILDSYLQPVPVGVTGELYIGGDGLAKGYLNQPELTSERFVSHSFDANMDTRLYKTGDLACYRPDGNIEFLGRADQQVKIRGFRIELGEIEAVLDQHPAVQESVVQVWQGENADKRLVAYLAIPQESKPGVGELRAYLQSRVPEHMIPSLFVLLDAFPLTSNGKVDRKSLPAPDESQFARDREWVGPRTPAEQSLAEIWSEVLGVQRIGVHDNFFEIGGHSLLATQVISRISSHFGVEVSLRTFFEQPIIEHLAALVDNRDRSDRRIPLRPLHSPARELAPLSFTQERVWFFEQMEPGTGVYHIPGAIRLSGQLDIFALQRAFGEIVQRHEALRTTFVEADGHPMQKIHPTMNISVPFSDLRNLPEELRNREVERLASEEAERPFDLAAGPLARFRLLQLEDREYVLLFALHHIISDGWSIDILFREFGALYESCVTRKKHALPEMTMQYADYSEWQRDWLQSEERKRQLHYWKGKLGGHLPVLQLPTDRPRPAVQTFRGASESFTLSKEFTDTLSAISQREGATLFMTLLAAFKTLLYRYSGQHDILVGTPIANRMNRDCESVIGFFANTLVLRSDLSHELSFTQLLAQVKQTSIDAYANQELPFEKLVEELQPERTLSHSPLFQVMFVLQNTPKTDVVLPNLAFVPVQAETRVSKFDITLFMEQTDQGLTGSFEYNTDLFDASTIQRMIGHYQTLLEGIAMEPGCQISKLPLLTATERHQLLVEWNDTKAEYPEDMCFHQLFEEQVEKTPDEVAVVCGDVRWTYRELNRRANMLARYLQKNGVGPEQLVGICLERSAELVLAILGIHKAGGAYVPIDPGYPKERISFIVSDAKPSLLLTQERLCSVLEPGETTVINLDADWDIVQQESDSNPVCIATPENLAYVIYTSGSTGTPKGALIIHRGLVNYLHWCKKAYPAEEGTGAPVHSSVAFDLTITSMFVPLIAGRTVMMLPETEGVEGLGNLLKESENFSLVKITPAHIQLLNQQLSPDHVKTCTRSLVIGGENLLAETVALWRRHAPGTALFNEYGPTETVVGCIVYQIPENMAATESVPIGRPIDNMRVYLLDSNMQPVPIGVPGEIYIGGAGVARGYLNRPELTAERFIEDPFYPEQGSRLYKTGDLARYLPDGTLEYLGRTDHQVKVRGYRIELGEIEGVLSQHPAVKDNVIAVMADGSGEKSLVAYVVMNPDTRSAHVELRAYLQEKLPVYMVPSHFVTLDELPLTSNGKVDRNALPLPERSGTELESSYMAPRNPVEAKLVTIWEDLLSVSPIGVYDNFFRLGGHSLLAVRLFARIKEEFHQNVPLSVLFKDPTIAHLAQMISQSKTEIGHSSLVTIQPNGSHLPFFCVHPIGGGVFCYQRLSGLLGSEQPFYGLQSRGLADDQEPLSSVEEMAIHYLEQIRSVQKSGPYVLAGWSFGGIVAYEMAYQLREAGEQIAALILMDSFAQAYRKDAVHDQVTVLAMFVQDLLGITAKEIPGWFQSLRDIPIEQAIHTLMNTLIEQELLGQSTSFEEFARLFRVFQANWTAYRHYVPKSSGQPIILFTSGDRDEGVTGIYSSPSNGWEEVTNGEIEIHELPGNHFTILQSPGVEQIAQSIATTMRRIHDRNWLPMNR